MRAGKLQQLATPAELYERPANLFVARFCGSPPMNTLDGEIADGAFTHAAGRLPLEPPLTNGPVKLGFRPEHAEFVQPGTPGSLAGDIYVVEPLGNETLVTVRVEGDLLNIRAAADFHRAVGERTAVRPLPGRVHLFEQESGEARATSTERGPAGAGQTATAGI
jgi:multiple sugar transport system ATP-binding protein